jgi:hypothetical protein
MIFAEIQALGIKKIKLLQTKNPKCANHICGAMRK